LQSLFLQTVNPDLLLVNVSDHPYLQDQGIMELPGWLKDDRITVNWERNTGPYRKLIPALSFADDSDLVVTADDDILYGPNWLASLVKLAKLNSDVIISARARQMRRTILGGWQNYAHWPLVKTRTTGLHLLPTGGAGVVYRKELLDLEFLGNSEFLKIAPTADDLWFRMASLRLRVNVLVDPAIDSDSIYLPHTKRLYGLNARTGRLGFWRKSYERTVGKARDWLGVPVTSNDIAWRKLVRFSDNGQSRQS